MLARTGVRTEYITLNRFDPVYLHIVRNSKDGMFSLIWLDAVAIPRSELNRTHEFPVDGADFFGKPFSAI